MKRWRVEAIIEEKWTVDVDAKDEDDASQKVFDMDRDELHGAGDFQLFEIEQTECEMESLSEEDEE